MGPSLLLAQACASFAACKRSNYIFIFFESKHFNNYMDASQMEATLPLAPQVARDLLEKFGEVMFEKVLTTSDTSGQGRIVIPKVRR